MNVEATMQAILNELVDIKRQLAYLANPLATVSAAEKAKAIKAAMATGDKRALKETLKKINGEPTSRKPRREKP